MPSQQLIINVTPGEKRVAVLEDGRLAEIIHDHGKVRAHVGDIYKGTVSRVLPGMNAAFIDIGHAKSAFLFGGDIVDPSVNYDFDPEANVKPTHVPAVQDFLKDGQEVIVQVSKEPLGTKGPRVTMHLTIPGRYVVIMPHYTYIGVSRRIEDLLERERLKNAIVKMVGPEPQYGAILRTAAIGVSDSQIARDLEQLQVLWELLHKKLPYAKNPSLIYSDLDPIKKIIRDLFSDQMERIVVDDREAFEDLSRFLAEKIPDALNKLELYMDKIPIFDVYEIEFDIAQALNSRVELPSGGYLVIQETEALTTIDVNTGRFVGKGQAKTTILKNNLEAVIRIVEQLRLRNIGGIIILDFIDMETLEDREIVFNSLQDELKKDRARTNVLRVSELGLVQMTRKRTSESLEKQLLADCPHCSGKGKVKTLNTEAHDLFREIVRCSLQTGSHYIRLTLRPDLKEFILNQEKDSLHKLKKDHHIELDFVTSNLTLDLLRESPFEVNPI